MKTWVKVTIVLFGLFLWAMVVKGTYDTFDEVLPASLSYYEYEEGGWQVDAATVAIFVGGVGSFFWIIGLNEYLKDRRINESRKDVEREELRQGKRPRERRRLTVVAGPVRFPGRLVFGGDLIARTLDRGDVTWTEIWDSENGFWVAVNDEDLPPLESGTPLTEDEAARLDDRIPREGRP